MLLDSPIKHPETRSRFDLPIRGFFSYSGIVAASALAIVASVLISLDAV